MNEKKEQHDKGENKVRILIVDDHPIVRQGLTQLINQEPDLVVCAEVENAAQALDVIEKQQIDLAIVDISMEGTTGIQLTEKLKLRCPNLPVLILTMYDDPVYFKRALRAGAKGGVTKREAAQNIITAIRTVLGGEIYFSERVMQKFSQRPDLTVFNC